MIKKLFIIYDGRATPKEHLPKEALKLEKDTARECARIISSHYDTHIGYGKPNAIHRQAVTAIATAIKERFGV